MSFRQPASELLYKAFQLLNKSTSASLDQCYPGCTADFRYPSASNITAHTDYQLSIYMYLAILLGFSSPLKIMQLVSITTRHSCLVQGPRFSINVAW